MTLGHLTNLTMTMHGRYRPPDQPHNDERTDAAWLNIMSCLQKSSHYMSYLTVELAHCHWRQDLRKAIISSFGSDEIKGILLERLFHTSILPISLIFCFWRNEFIHVCFCHAKEAFHSFLDTATHQVHPWDVLEYASPIDVSYRSHWKYVQV
jgi:hypothetical protein